MTASPRTQGGAGAKAKWILVLMLVLGAAAVGFIVYSSGGTASLSVGGPSLMRATCGSLGNVTASGVEHSASGGNGGHAYFLIVESDPPGPYAGLNGSYFVPTTTRWPVMRVHVGQVVSIHIINCASSEAHGLQVQTYYDKVLVAIQPGKSYDITFTATSAGRFRVYCDIPCAIHALMQNGELIVS